jgi:hypothetical protein
MNDEKQAQDRVIGMVDDIMRVIAGTSQAEAQTTLTLVIVASIISIESNPAVRLQMVDGMAEHVKRYLDREDIVEWISASVRPIHPSKGHA